MNHPALRKLVAFVIVIMVINEFVTWLAAGHGALFAFLAVVVLVLISASLVQLAKKDAKKVGWFIIPSLLFAVIPGGARIYSIFREQLTGMEILRYNLEYLFGFLIPVLVLLYVWIGLRERKSAVAEPPAPMAEETTEADEE